MPDKHKGEWAEFLRGPPVMEIVQERPPASAGWRRRSQFDRPGVVAWERPDGRVCGTASRDAKAER